ncbi:MAG: Ig-like domain-containing protein [Candidatus Marinimicrobia bacterium]|nr:Ig-like domain-containing protein [Candidatus Neomarinimicrobiota bacterium]MCF7921608.1 Ig-like domain-containing protein [Candidatus Neomarinimicrobiota bacterium]
MNRKNKSYLFAIMILVVLGGLFSCERETGILGPAPFPTDAEVFIDGFGPSVEPQSFLGTKLDALQIDESEAYSGTQSIIITIPGPGDLSGSTWSGGALVAGIARDLTGYNALTFWAKANKSLTLNSVGLGNDNEAPNPYVVERVNVPLTSSWTKYVIPIPLPAKLPQEQGLFYYSEGQENGEGATIWLDEIQFESLGTIAHPAISFASTSATAYQGSTVSVPSVTISYDVDGTNVDVVASSNYLSFSSSDTSIVTINADGTMTANNPGSATITATLGDNSATGSITVNVDYAPVSPAADPTHDAADVMALFSDTYTSVTPNMNWYTYWTWSTAEVNEFDIDGNEMMIFSKLNFAGVEFADEQIDASAMTHFHMDIWTPNYITASSRFIIKLVDFGANGAYGGGDDTEHALTLSTTTTPALSSNSWVSIDVPMTAFTGATAQSHLAQLVLECTGGALTTIFVDNVYLYR